MGVDITFKKMKRDRAEKILAECGADNFFRTLEIPDGFDWSKFTDETEHTELTWFCGRHLIYDAILGFPGDELKVPSKKDLEELYLRCADVTTRYRVHYDELLTIPVDVLKRYIAEAEKNEEVMVTIPLEDKSDSDYCVDDTDWYQAKSFMEDVWPRVQTMEDDEIILVDFSY